MHRSRLATGLLAALATASGLDPTKTPPRMGGRRPRGDWRREVLEPASVAVLVGLVVREPAGGTVLAAVGGAHRMNLAVAVVQLLTDDSAVAIAVPACLFLIGYSATIWWMSARRGARMRTWVYALTTCAAVTIHLAWMVAASFSAAMAVWAWTAGANPAARAVLVAGSPSELDYIAGQAYLLGAVVWPVAWGLVGGIILLAGRGGLGLRVRSVLAALVAGCLVVVVPLAALNVAEVLMLIPDQVRIVGLPAFMVAAAVFVAVAGLRSRARALDGTGVASMR